VEGFGFRVAVSAFPDSGKDPATLIEAASRGAQANLP
jgi:hypothetical protein